MNTLTELIEAHEAPKRQALTAKYPVMKTPVVFVRRSVAKAKNLANRHIARRKSHEYFPCVAARHQSVLRRKLGVSDPKLQEQKIVNLKQACEKLDGVVIEPGQIFSLWEIVGNPTRRRGYVEGMLLSDGKVVSGVGGGLCQLSNFLCWIFLHADTKLIERYHHSKDVFPDSGRVLPFGSGATCFYNYRDLKIQNIGAEPLQLRLWVSETHLKGQLLSPEPPKVKFSILEKNHIFVKKGEAYYRYNELVRQSKYNGDPIREEELFANFAPVLYEITPEYLSERGYQVINLTNFCEK